MFSNSSIDIVSKVSEVYFCTFFQLLEKYKCDETPLSLNNIVHTCVPRSGHVVKVPCVVAESEKPDCQVDKLSAELDQLLLQPGRRTTGRSSPPLTNFFNCLFTKQGRYFHIYKTNKRRLLDQQH
jgi:hypothetical protein